MQALLGKKIGMTQVYDDAGVLQPVTVVQAGPCNVLQIKTVQTDGYSALQLGFEDKKLHRALQPQIKAAAKAKSKPKKFMREVRLTEDAQGIELGQVFTVDVFEGVGVVDVVGTTKGKGFQGVMKRHHFGGQCASHGTERKHRSPGSIGSHATTRGWGGDIKKGKRMAGHMGFVQCTSRHHKLVKVDKENNLLLIKGAVPGANGGYVFICVSKTAKKPKAAQ